MKPTTIEKTDKLLKLHLVYSVLTIIWGTFVLSLNSFTTNAMDGLIVGGITVVIGVIYQLIIRIKIWWNHG